MTTRKWRVTGVVKERDRTLLYGRDEAKATPIDDDYHVIGRHGILTKIGDVVDYEPVGVNFGWMIDPQ